MPHLLGGSSCAAHFLNEFVDGPLVHFDIFASTWNWSNDYPGANYGATGAPLIRYLKRFRRIKKGPDFARAFR